MLQVSSSLLSASNHHPDVLSASPTLLLNTEANRSIIGQRYRQRTSSRTPPLYSPLHPEPRNLHLTPVNRSRALLTSPTTSVSTAWTPLRSSWPSRRSSASRSPTRTPTPSTPVCFAIFASDTINQLTPSSRERRRVHPQAARRQLNSPHPIPPPCTIKNPKAGKNPPCILLRHVGSTKKQNLLCKGADRGGAAGASPSSRVETERGFFEERNVEDRGRRRRAGE